MKERKKKGKTERKEGGGGAWRYRTLAFLDLYPPNRQ